MKRRDFLKATAISAGALLLPKCGPGAPMDVDGTQLYPQSVASGDPRPDSVILWTRVDDTTRASADLELEVEVAGDELFMTKVASAKVTALARYDHCAKVKVTGLSAATSYFYRFGHVKDGKRYLSRVGKTKTAPAPDADVVVKFAYVSCQDFVGRYYNAYWLAAEAQIDFWVHLGDYIYETTGDPSFQDVTGARKIEFPADDPGIPLGTADKRFYAARSLGNYRQLYRTIRADKALQAMHERFPMIATWDDHEYSDDCNGARAKYTDDSENELDQARRGAANQAWFEYQPVDFDTPNFEYDASAGPLRIYRDFRFGKHVHLVMTDLRQYRADNLIPGNAFPGKVAVDQARLVAKYGSVPAVAKPYVEIDTFAGGRYKQVLVGAAPTVGYQAAQVTGKVSVEYINQIVTRVNMATGMSIPTIDPMMAGLEKGISYFDAGKLSAVTSNGSRYLTIKPAYDIIGEITYQDTSGASEEVMGAEQEQWFLSTMKGSNATWKVWGNEYCLTSLAIDLRAFGFIPKSFQQIFYLNSEDWNGYRNKRSALIKELAPLGGVVALTGDIHAFYAATPATNDDPTKKIVEFVTGGISSKPFKSMLQSQVRADPVLSQVSGAEQLADGVDSLLRNEANATLGYMESGNNGFAVVEASGAELLVTQTQIAESDGAIDYAGRVAELRAKAKQVELKTIAGGSELFLKLNGSWVRWDATRQDWV
jgi:alkaline phosphatase D